MLTVAVVVPAYNAEPFIEAALDSVAAQTRQPDEVFVVNDGSTDDTAACVQDWMQRTGRRVELINQPNGGISAARNVAIRKATSDLIALLDADDVFLPDHLERAVNAIERHGDVILCFGDGEAFGPDGPERRSLVYGTDMDTLDFDRSEDGVWLFRGSAYSSLLPASYIPVSATVFRRDAALRIGLYDEDLRVTEDRDMLLRMSRAGRFAFVPKIVHLKRSHAENVTHPRNMARNMRFQFRVLRKALDNAGEMRLTADERRRTRRQLNLHARSLLYEASRRGMMGYLGAAAFVARRGALAPVFHLRHLVRAVAFSIPRLRDTATAEAPGH